MPMSPRRTAAAWLLASLAALSTLIAGCGGADPSADITITAAGPSQPVAPGGVAEFQMTVANAGPDGVDGVLVENLLDARLTLLEITCTATGGAGCPSAPAAGMTLNLPANGALTFTVRASVPATGVLGLVLNSMGTRSVPEDPNLENNSAVATAIVGSAEIIANYIVNDVVVAGTSANFIATVLNIGPGATSNVGLAITLPAGYSASEFVCEAFDGAICPDLNAADLVVPEMPAGGRITLQIRVPVPPEARGDLASSITATAGGDGNLDNNTASAVTTLVAATANLAVTHTASAGTVAGTEARFIGAVINTGPNDSRNVAIVFTPPSGHGVGTVTCLSAGGAICPDAPAVSMNVPLIPLGGSLRFTFPVPVGTLERGDLTAVFQATGDGDPASEDNTRAITTTVLAPNADVGVRHVVLTQVSAGTQAAFTASATNFGPDTARRVALDFTLADGYEVDSISCTAVGGTVCPSTPTTSMLVDEMPAGSTIRLSVFVTARASGTIRANFSASTEGDPQPTNDSAEAVTTIVPPPARLSVNQFAPAVTAAGGTTTFTAFVANGGPSEATQVVLTQALQTAGYTIVSVGCTPSLGATCPLLPGNPDSATVTLNAGTMAVGATLQMRYTVRVPAAAVPGSLITARFSASADNDPAVDDNVIETSTAIAAATANLAVSHATTLETPKGYDAEFTAIVANLGPSTARAVALSFTPKPAELSYTSTCTATGGATCPASLTTPVDLPVGGSLRFLVFVPTKTLAEGATLDAVFTASYAGDPDLENNSASAATRIGSAQDPRDGEYTVAATDGRGYTLTLDYVALTYSMVGPGVNRSGSFTATADGGYQISGNERWRASADLVVGGFDFGSGVLPFVAGRSFLTSVSALPSAELNLVARVVDASGASTRATGARWSPGRLQICTTEPFVSVGACAPGDLKTYALTVNASGLFTAFELASGQSFSFRVARAGAGVVYLRTGGETTRVFQVGLLENAGPSGGTVQGAASDGAWGTSTLSATSYQFNGSAPSGPVTRAATLAPLGATAPIGLRVGDRSPDGARILVLQQPMLSIVAGARNQLDGSPGIADGAIELGAP